MPTPTFTDVQDTLQEVRLYTEFDAYHFTVDNRPLEDLVQNVGELAKATDAGRRAGLIEAIGNSAFQSWFTGVGGKLLGFPARNISTGVIGLGAGILFSEEELIEGVAKKGVLLSEVEVQTPFPFNAGKERKHLIQIRFSEFGTGEESLYEDLGNEYLPESVISGKVEWSVVSTGEVDVGTGVVPGVTPGWTALYSVTCVYGDTSSAISKVATEDWYDQDFFSILQAQVDLAEGYALDSQTALDAILGTAGVYETAAEGIAATVDGEFFSVPSLSSHEYVILYKNVSGVATEVKRYPSAIAMETSLVTSGIFSTTGNGLAGTTDGMYFSVPSNDASESVIIYRNNAGVASEVKRYPSYERFNQVVAHTTSEANRAESARDVAQLAAGIYGDTAAGLAATANGEYFSVPSPNADESVVIYRNDSGVATEIKRYPSAGMIDAVMAVGDQIASDAAQVADDVLAADNSASLASGSATIAESHAMSAAQSAEDAQGYALSAGNSVLAIAESEANALQSANQAQESASTATLKAGEALLSAEDAYNSFVQAETFTTQASVYAARAESARDSAQVAVNMFPTVAAGLAGTGYGQYFTVVPPTTDDYLILYINDSGLATELRRYPSSQFLIETASEVQANADAARDHAHSYLEKMAGLTNLYSTYAEALGDIANLLEGDAVMVLVDESHEGRTSWYEVSGGNLTFIREDSSVKLVTVPGGQGGSGAEGYIAVDSEYLYVAIGANSWRRVPLGWDTFSTVNLSNSAPQNLGVATSGISTYVSRADHVHKMPTVEEVGAAPATHVGSSGASHAVATGTEHGFMSKEDKAKLDGVAPNATANSSDSFLRNRTNHTGTQPISSVEGLAEALANVVSKAQVIPNANTTINLGLSDASTYIQTTAGSSVTVNLPPQGSVAWAADTEIHVEQGGDGGVTFVPGSGVTINSLGGSLALSGKNGVVTLKRVAENTWTAIGALGSAPVPPASPQSIIIACSDETTALTAGAAKVTFRMPYAFTLTGVRASLTTAQTSGNILTVDINEGGVSILSTKLTIDNTEKTSKTAATPAVISDAALADDAEITVDIDQIGDGTAKGLKVVLIGVPV